MPSITVIGEGDTDRALVKAHCPDVNVPKPEKDDPKGREAAILRAVRLATHPLPSHTVLLLDRNGFLEEQIRDEVRNIFGKEAGTDTRSTGNWFFRGASALHLVIAGLPGDEELISLGVTRRYSSDDYLLRLCLIDESLKTFLDGENNLSHKPKSASELRGVLKEIAGLLQEKGISLYTSKSYVGFIRAIIGFQASRAAFTQLLVERCPSKIRDAILGDLKKEIELDIPPHS